jgi:hypothetical protein
MLKTRIEPIYLRLREARQASKLNGAEAGLDRRLQERPAVLNQRIELRRGKGIARIGNSLVEMAGSSHKNKGTRKLIIERTLLTNKQGQVVLRYAVEVKREDSFDDQKRESLSSACIDYSASWCRGGEFLVDCYGKLGNVWGRALSWMSRQKGLMVVEIEECRGRWRSRARWRKQEGRGGGEALFISCRELG